MNQIDQEILGKALGLLAELIEDQEPQHYVVCEVLKSMGHAPLIDQL
jgi:hypothetical protein